MPFINIYYFKYVPQQNLSGLMGGLKVMLFAEANFGYRTPHAVNQAERDLLVTGTLIFDEEGIQREAKVSTIRLEI